MGFGHQGHPRTVQERAYVFEQHINTHRLVCLPLLGVYLLDDLPVSSFYYSTTKEVSWEEASSALHL